jgi:hypothetical protein
MNTGSLLLRLGLVGTLLIFARDIPLAQTQEVTRTELQRVAVSDLPGREGIMYKGVFAPGGTAAKHTHPGDEFVYVLKGTPDLVSHGVAVYTQGLPSGHAMMWAVVYMTPFRRTTLSLAAALLNRSAKRKNWHAEFGDRLP